MMQTLGRSFVRAYNHRHARQSSPWEGRFRSTVVEPDTHFLACLRFVEDVAPAGTALARTPAHPSWSSAAHHLGQSVDPLVSEHSAFWSLGNTPFEREAAYRRWLDSPAPPEFAPDIAGAALKGWALGSESFAARISAQSGRRAQPLARGRPRRAGTSSRD
jgi:putative transposase